jgi:chorismate mutase
MTHLPIVVDPSHGTGRRSLVSPMALGAAAVGADGLLIEVHPDPPHARSDGDQSLSFPEFGSLMDELRRLEFLRQRDGTDAPAGPIPAGVGEMRTRVDEIDDRLVRLLEERARLALAIANAKGGDAHGHDPQREQELLNRARSRAAGPMDGEEVEMVIEAVLKASRQMQRRRASEQRATVPS